ncbi:MAG: serine hydrolase domain-containing protein [Acidimicrobiia bacterium]
MSDLYGEVSLAMTLREELPSRHRHAAIAVASPETTRTASIGSDLDADYELGSISKAITGLLYADAVARGEIAPTSTLGSLLPLDDSAVASVTLDALATHRTGISSVPRVRQPLRRTWRLYRHGRNPYGDTLEQLLAQAREVRVSRPKPAYSNFGFELLGHAVAAASGTTFVQLVEERIAGELGLTGMYTPLTEDARRPTALDGFSRRGRPRQPWTGEALGPAGGIRAGVTDMALLSQALLTRAAPGMSALDPIASFSGKTRIGAAWVVMSLSGREITWHNGGTGGFRSWIGLDRDAGVGVALLSATSSSVDAIGFSILSAQTRIPRT